MVKVSGAAMTLMNNRIYGGYSLLLDVNYEAMDKVLKPNRKRLHRKGLNLCAHVLVILEKHWMKSIVI